MRWEQLNAEVTPHQYALLFAKATQRLDASYHAYEFGGIKGTHLNKGIHLTNFKLELVYS
jgi:hypothetical protein